MKVIHVSTQQASDYIAIGEARRLGIVGKRHYATVFQGHPDGSVEICVLFTEDGETKEDLDGFTRAFFEHRSLKAMEET